MADASPASQETFLTALSEKLLDNAKLILSTAVGGLLEYAGHGASALTSSQSQGSEGHCEARACQGNWIRNFGWLVAWFEEL